MTPFIHLHNHSHFSLLDGCASISAILKAAKKADMPAVALTDHGVMFGAMEFMKKAQDPSVGIKPIVGCEMYITVNGSRFDKGQGGGGSPKNRMNTHHLLLLVKDEVGYGNLVKLTTLAHTEGFYYKPRIDLDLLSKYSKGLVATSACIGGVVSSYLVEGNYEEAIRSAARYKEIFGEDFYIELQNHGLDSDTVVMRDAPKVAKHLGLKIVGTNDCHYIEPNHALPHNIMLLIPDASKGVTTDYMKLRYKTDQLYFKSSEEMAEIFKEFPEAISSTNEIAEKCNLVIGKQNKMPDFPIPVELGINSLDDYLDKLSWEGLSRRYTNITQELRDRLEHELNVIKGMKYAGYFLIVQDFVNAARSLKVRVGPGRGSVAGSLVAYALGITDVDPLSHGLLFERFLNPDRISMPDIDIDFEDSKRERVFEYVREKYGESNVAQIVTFGTLSTRAVLKDIARVIGIHHTEIERITKSIPLEYGKPMPLQEALDKVPELKAYVDSADERTRLLIETAKILEGLNRNVGKHAAGIVITPGPVSDFVPMYVTPQQLFAVTQFSMKDLEDAGLLKMDFLGLRTLTVLEDTLRRIEKNHGIRLDLNALPPKDEKTFDLFARGNTVGVFQFESSGMQEYLKKLKPTVIGDLVAMNALYRPGPMEMIENFIDRKHGRTKIEYLHPRLEPILQDTYGVIVYQEQVMRIASDIAGYSLAHADILRRAVGKKDPVKLIKEKIPFIEGAKKNGVDEKRADQIFELIVKFANYGFNKSHSVAYSILAYQTAYLKAHYPLEYMAAALTSEKDNTDKIALFLDDARSIGLDILHPDINLSELDFTVVGGSIRFGLGAIKGVGEKAVESIIRTREHDGIFNDIFEFCRRVNLQLVNKRTIEGLVMAGAFDSLHSNRAQLFGSLERAIQYGQQRQEAIMLGQDSLFDLGASKVVERPVMPPAEPWSESEKLTKEKAALGFYITGHPLKRYEAEAISFSTARFAEPERVQSGQVVRLCVLLTGVKTMLDKKRRQMAFLTSEDLSGKGECVVFADQFEKFRSYLHVDSLVMIIGKADVGVNAFKILVNEVYPLEIIRETFTRKVYFGFDLTLMNEEGIHQLKSILKEHTGPVQCYLKLNGGSSDANQVYLLPQCMISVSNRVLEEVSRLPGFKGVRYRE